MPIACSRLISMQKSTLTIRLGAVRALFQFGALGAARSTVPLFALQGKETRLPNCVLGVHVVPPALAPCK